MILDAFEYSGNNDYNNVLLPKHVICWTKRNYRAADETLSLFPHDVLLHSASGELDLGSQTSVQSQVVS